MSWQNLGFTVLKPEWVFFPLTTATTFKISQSFSFAPLGYFLMGQAFNLNPVEMYGVFRVYPTKETRIKSLYPPQDFQEANITERWLGVKLFYRSYLWTPDGWQINIRQWIE